MTTVMMTSSNGSGDDDVETRRRKESSAISSLLDDFERIATTETKTKTKEENDTSEESTKEDDPKIDDDFEKIDHESFEDADDDDLDAVARVEGADDGKSATAGLNEDLLRLSGQLCFLHNFRLSESDSSSRRGLLRKQEIPFDGNLIVEIDNTMASWHNKEVSMSITEDVFGKPLFPLASNVTQSKYATQHAMLAKGYLTQLLSADKTYERFDDDASFKIRVANGRSVRFAIHVKEGSVFNLSARVNHKDVTLNVYFQMDIRKALDRVRHAVARATASSASRIQEMASQMKGMGHEIEKARAEKIKAEASAKLKESELRQQTIERQRAICEFGKKMLRSEKRAAMIKTEHASAIQRLNESWSEKLARHVQDARTSVRTECEEAIAAMKADTAREIRRARDDASMLVKKQIEDAVQAERASRAKEEKENAMAAAIEEIDMERKRALEQERETFRLRKSLDRERRKVGLLEMRVEELKRDLQDASDRIEKERESSRVACETQRIQIATVAALTSAAKIGSIESDVSELKSEHRALELEYSKLSHRFHHVRTERNRLRELLGVTDLHIARDLDNELNGNVRKKSDDRRGGHRRHHHRGH